MEQLEGKTAFVTGGASGIGLAMARAFGAAGMNVMIADIEDEPREAALIDLRERQIKAEGAHCDVGDRASVEAAAQATVDAFGKVHVVCNNAGVGAGGPIDDVRPSDWEWIVSVNLMGVVYGLETFLPLIRSHGEGGHIVNTASMAGLVSPPGMEPYSATKYAVVAMSEGWRGQLEPENIGVSVLCPGFVRTRIFESSRARQERFGPAQVRDEPSVGEDMVKAGIDPDIVGACVLEAVRDNDLYIFTHPDMRAHAEARFNNILDAFDKAAARPALAGVDPHSPQILNMLQN